MDKNIYLTLVAQRCKGAEIFQIIVRASATSGSL
jgi:hypothetical protein